MDFTFNISSIAFIKGEGRHSEFGMLIPWQVLAVSW